MRFYAIIALLSMCPYYSFAQLIITRGHSWKDVLLYQNDKPADAERANTNYSTSTRLSSCAWSKDSYAERKRTLIHFDLSYIEPGTKVSSAIIELFSDPTVTSSSAWDGNSQLGGSNAFFIEKVTQAWNESQVSWNTQPTTTTTGRIWIGPSSSPTENLKVNITALVQEMIDNPTKNYGLKMRLESELKYRSRNYASEDHTNSAIHPKLVINFEKALSIKEENDYMLAPLDKTKIPTRVLYDRVFPFAKLESYSGNVGSDASSSEHFFQSYYELRNSNYNSMAKLEDVHIKADVSFSSGTIPIGILNYNLNILDPAAVSKNLIYVNNGQAYDTPNRTQSPYLSKKTVIASPLLSKDINVLFTGTNTFKLDPQFIFSNSGATVQYCDINFNDGTGVKRVNSNASVSINYTTPGTKNLSYVIRYSNGNQLTAYSTLTVMAKATISTDPCDGASYIDAIGYPFNVGQYDRVPSIRNESAKVTAYIYFADANCAAKVIRKPIVFLDGIDPLNDRDHATIYKEYINKGSLAMADKFRADGYDIIIVDYEDGGDFIEKNALGVIKLLENIYTKHSTTIQQDFVVIGPSMGALVGQYALAEAGRRGISVRTRLFISFDGPHQGANMPISLQQSAGYVFTSKMIKPSYDCKTGAYKNPTENDFPGNRPAARQLLLHHYQANSEVPAPHPFRNIFLNNMKVGYPDCRNVAIINGSKTGLNQTIITPSKEILKVDLTVASLDGMQYKLLDWRFYASPASSRAVTFNAATLKRLAKKLGIQTSHVKYARPVPGNYSLDVIPGGFSTTMKEIADAELGKFGLACVPLAPAPLFSGNYMGMHLINLKIDKYVKITSTTPHHSFIPTTSAVDLRHPTATYVYNFANENLTCSGYSPFNMIYAPNENQEHVAVTPENANWFTNEIKGTPHLAVIKSNAQINGLSSICGETSYSVSSFPTGSTFTWTTSSNLTIVSGRTSSTVKVTTNSTSSGSTWVEVKVVDRCGVAYQPVRKNLAIGEPSYTWTDNVINGVCPYDMFTVSVNVTDGASSFIWSTMGDLRVAYQSGNRADISANTTFQYGLVNASFLNACGKRQQASKSYGRSSSCPGNTYTYSVYPNPSDSELFVEEHIEEDSTIEKSSLLTEPTFNVELFNGSGKKIKERKSDNSKVVLNVQDLQDGNYYLHIIKEGKTIKHHIVISR